MKWIAFALALFLAGEAHAQSNIIGSGVRGDVKVGAAAYVGPGDIVGNWEHWGGVRAFSAATAGTKALNVCDAGNVCGDVNTNAVTGDLPTTIIANGTNCSGGACTVQKIYDQTGANFCGGSPCDLVQATPGNRAILKINCLPNNKWCLQMTGATSQTYKITYTGGPVEPETFSMILIIPAAGVQEVLSDSGGSGMQFRHDGGANSGELFPPGTAFTWTDNAWHGIALVFHFGGVNGTFLAVDNGSHQVLSPGGAFSLATLDVAGAFSLPLTGNVVEVGLNSTELSAGQITSLNTNQHTWGGF